MYRLLIIMVCLCLPAMVAAQDRIVRLHAPDALVATGLTKHILPRFSLKTQVRVQLVDPSEADMIWGDTGRALFNGLGSTWHMALQNPDHAPTKRFADWLTSDIGKRTIYGFEPEGVALFTAPDAAPVEVVEVEIDGDKDLGRKVSYEKCGRCHVTEKGRGMWGIGSTPSFFVLRAFDDWEGRFAAFYVLNPHPAFTQIAEVTDPFPQDRPSPIAPVEMTIDELEAMLAYVSGLAAADLGAPLDHQ